MSPNRAFAFQARRKAAATKGPEGSRQAALQGAATRAAKKNEGGPGTS